uniref:Uncharacterized protein n=1 Tax=Arundo donax TaxID=35708 RepID=A0A0A9HQ58_ARUDO
MLKTPDVGCEPRTRTMTFHPQQEFLLLLLTTTAVAHVIQLPINRTIPWYPINSINSIF